MKRLRRIWRFVMGDDREVPRLTADEAYARELFDAEERPKHFATWEARWDNIVEAIESGKLADAREPSRTEILYRHRRRAA